MESESLLKKQQELLEEIDKYNKLIFEDAEVTKTDEFNNIYKKLNYLLLIYSLYSEGEGIDNFI